MSAKIAVLHIAGSSSRDRNSEIGGAALASPMRPSATRMRCFTCGGVSRRKSFCTSTCVASVARSLPR